MADANSNESSSNSSSEDNDESLRSKTKSTTGSSTHRTRCGVCDACRRQDCGQCMYCVKKKKFGGKGDSKQACVHRRCHDINERRKASRRRPRSRASSMEDDDDEELSNTHNIKHEASDDRDSAEAGPKKVPRRSSRERDDINKSSSHSSSTSNTNANSNNKDEDPLLTMLSNAFGNCPPPSLFQPTTTTTMNKPSAAGANGTIQCKYGMPIPQPIFDKCAGCGQLHAPASSSLSETSDQPAVSLLCDGPNCNREYHLECCLPPLTKVPDGNYYCVDCHPEGAPLTALKQYLEEHDEQRAKHFAKLPRLAWDKYAISPELDFLYDLWDRDWCDNKDNWTEEKGMDEASDDTQDNSQKARVPQSELGRILEISHVLMAGLQTKDASALTTPGSKPKPRTRTPPTSYTKEQICELLLGKPLRLYCSVDDNYHNGRIVDYRFIDIECQNRSSIHSQPSPAANKKPAAKQQRNKSSTGIVEPHDDFFTNQVEFLVRFLPGTEEHRKVLYYHWIRLEEHSLAVGSHVIWGLFLQDNAEEHQSSPKKDSYSTPVKQGSTPGADKTINYDDYWRPALLYLRTTRELMPVVHLLREDHNEVRFHPKGLTSKAARRRKKNEPANGLPTGPASARELVHFKQPCRLWALARRIEHRTISEKGSDIYKLLSLGEAEVRDIFARIPNNKGGGEDDTSRTIPYSLARVELEEQRSIKRWKHEFPLRNRMGPKALTSRDAYALGPVRFANPTASDGSIQANTGNYHPVVAHRTNDDVNEEDEFADLCPLIPAPGLDRAYLMRRLVQQGVIKEPTKDIAATLECYLLT